MKIKILIKADAQAQIMFLPISLMIGKFIHTTLFELLNSNCLCFMFVYKTAKTHVGISSILLSH